MFMKAFPNIFDIFIHCYLIQEETRIADMGEDCSSDVGGAIVWKNCSAPKCKDGLTCHEKIFKDTCGICGNYWKAAIPNLIPSGNKLSFGNNDIKDINY